MKISNKVLLIIGTGLLLLGFIVSNIWHGLHNPMKPLYVELVNDTDTLIPSVVIEHGSAGLQEIA